MSRSVSKIQPLPEDFLQRQFPIWSDDQMPTILAKCDQAREAAKMHIRRSLLRRRY